MIYKKSRSEVRAKKHRRLRNRISGTASTPRLAVFRSNNHMYAQIIDDTVGKTLVSASTVQKEVKAELDKIKRSKSYRIGRAIMYIPVRFKRLAKKIYRKINQKRRGYKKNG